MIIAIDGPAAAGKGTLARNLALKLNFAYLDTGALYRAVGLKVIRLGKDPANEEEATAVAEKMTAVDFAEMMKDADLRTEIGASGAAKVAKNPNVRKALLKFQQDFAVHPVFNDGTKAEGAILDGRDIGTVVCPNADLKFFVTASVEKRAERRYKEYQEKNVKAVFEEILADVKKRDESDKNRANSPLIPADDAVIIDTSNLDINEVFALALTHIEQLKEKKLD